jgi:hypothetical protein
MKRRLAMLLVAALAIQVARAVEPTCQLRQPRLRVNRADIFTDQQEQWLGDAQAAMIEPGYTLLPATESRYLNTIGQRLLRQLPPTPVQYTFRVYESPDLRAFSLAGGHVYISRKLIMDARSEDELAAMLAQEIGRIYIHHEASAVTRRMERTMHVKKLGGRADVYDTFERMLNLPVDSYAFLSTDEQEHDELMADRVGIYAMIKAGYDPQAFATFLDRVNDNGGFTGNLLTDAFDLTPMVSVRVRTAKKIVSSLPETCRNPRPLYRPGFQPFQQFIERQRINPFVLATSGLDSFPLEQPINPALENVAISPDGKYILAQDDYQIHVLSAAPLESRFSVDALGAEMAQFTPDSQSLVFNYNDLHIERWGLAAGRPANIADFVDYAGCLQTSLSPDGRALACISQFYDSVWLKLADIQSGQMLYQNLHFFDGYLGLNNVGVQPKFEALMRWSRDGRYFVAASGLSAMAYDLQNRKQVKLRGTLSGLAQQRFAFVGPDTMVSTCDWSVKTGAAGETFTMCLTSFPGGHTLKKFELPPGWLASTAGNNSLLFGPAGNAAAVLFDPSDSRIEDEFREQAADARGTIVATEVPTGGLGLQRPDGKFQTIPLPVTPLSAVEASAFSLNGRYLALSNRARGAEWDLATGRRVALTSPFQAVAVDENGNLEAAFASHEIAPSKDPNLDRRMHRYVPWLSPLDNPLQLGTVRIRFKTLNVLGNLADGVRMDAYDARTEKRLWSQTFEEAIPTIVSADGDQTVLIQDAKSWTGGTKLKHTSDLPLQFINLEGTAVEVLANRTGKPEHALLTPQLPPMRQRRDQRTADIFGNLLAVYGNNNDTTVYGVTDGKRLFGFFGRALAGDETLGMVAATNRIQELNIYGIADGRRLAHYLLDQAVIAARFVPASRKLLVLTASQRVYRIDLSKLSAEGSSSPR